MHQRGNAGADFKKSLELEIVQLRRTDFLDAVAVPCDFAPSEDCATAFVGVAGKAWNAGNQYVSVAIKHVIFLSGGGAKLV